jgi:class I fructose-bisphosphate aldolase
MVNLKKITTKGRALFLAYDHGLEHGPDELEEFGGKAVDPDFVLQIAIRGGYNGVILQKGIAQKYYSKSKQKIPLILKLNGRTQMAGGEPVSQQICSVKEAKNLGAKAVGYTLYPGSSKENLMFKEFGKIVREAHELGLPAIAWVYPRGKKIKNETAPETIEYAARIGLELGADIVKIKYSSSRESFSKAVKAAGKTKVMLAGGPKVNEKTFLKVVKDVMASGAMGVVVGRNVWQNKNPLGITKKIKRIVFS